MAERNLGPCLRCGIRPRYAPTGSVCAECLPASPGTETATGDGLVDEVEFLQQRLSARWKCNHEFDGAICEPCFANIEVASVLLQDILASRAARTDAQETGMSGAPAPSPGAPDQVEALASVVCQHHAGSRIIGKGVSIPHMSDGETLPCQSCRAVARAVLAAGYLSPAQVVEAQAQALREAEFEIRDAKTLDATTKAVVCARLRDRADRLTREAGAAAEAGPDCWPGFDR